MVNLDKDKIAEQYHRHKGLSNKGLSSQWDNTRDCQSFYAGDFMSYTDRLQFADGRGQKKATIVQFNKVKPYVNAVAGFMSQNRRKCEYVARDENDQLRQFYSQFANAYSDYIRENANADQIESQADRDMLICGYGATETALTYGEGYSSRNPNGEILIGRLDPRKIGWDPAARAPNLIDSRFVWYEKIYNLQEALDLFDDAEPQDFEKESSPDMGQKVYYKRGGTYDKIQEVYDYESVKEDLVKVGFYQWYAIEKFYRCKNPLRTLRDADSLTYAKYQMDIIADEQDDKSAYKFKVDDEILNCSAKVKSQLEKLFEGQDLGFEAFRRRCYYTAVVSGKKVFTYYPNVDQSGFTIKFKTGDYDESNKRWFGMVNSLKEPTLYYNKALTELMFAIATNSKGGVMVEESAVDDIRQFEQSYGRTDAVVKVKDGALSGGKIMPKRAPFDASGLDGLLAIVDGAIPDVAGIDKTFLGSSENKLETAELQRQRIKQVTSALATYFDSISLYQKEQAKLMLPMMRVLAENNDGSMFKSFAPDGKIEFLRASPDNFVDDYDIIIREAPDTATQREERAQMLTEMATNLIQFDPNSARILYSMAIKDLNLEYTDMQKIMQVLVPDQQQIDPQYVQQLQQQIQQLQDEGNQAMIKKMLSDASLNMVKAEETIAKIKNTNADTQQKVLENVALQHSPDKNVNINI